MLLSFLVPSTPAKIIMYTDNIQASLILDSVSKSPVSAAIDIVIHKIMESLFQSIDSNRVTTYVFIIHTTGNLQRLIDRAHSYHNIRSPYIQCEST